MKRTTIHHLNIWHLVFLFENKHVNGWKMPFNDFYNVLQIYILKSKFNIKKCEIIIKVNYAIYCRHHIQLLFSREFSIHCSTSKQKYKFPDLQDITEYYKNLFATFNYTSSAISLLIVLY